MMPYAELQAEGHVMCPSVFGAYPVLKAGPCWARLGGRRPVRLTLRQAHWQGGHFSAALSLGAAGGVSLRLAGGAATPRTLSQALLSQCLESLGQRFSGEVAAEALADLLFDQLVQDGMRGLFRQQKGICQTQWLSVSDVQELSLRVDDPSLVLGEILKHPAALRASTWKSLSPLGGACGRVSPGLSLLFERAEPHLRAGGCLVLGPTVINGVRSRARSIELPQYGWIVTGRRGGYEAQARERARREHRPLLIVTRQDEAAAVLHPELFQCVLLDERSKAIGPFRAKMIEKLGNTVSMSPKLITA